MSTFNLAILALVLGVLFFPSLGQNTSCTVTSYGNVQQAAKVCQNLVLQNIIVPATQTLQLDLLPGATLQFQGTIQWQYSEWAGPLMQITGNNVKVRGNGAILDGQGAKWWDGSGDNGKVKPKFLRIKTTGGSVLKDITMLNCPHQCVSINGASDTTLDNFIIDLSAGDSAGGKNTDGFDVSTSNRITVMNSVVKNQDDCVAINQGSDMYFSNLTCTGSHGLSLSVGQTSASGSVNTVRNVTFINSAVINSDNGIHIKTHSDSGTGSVSDIKYINIKLVGIRKYGINVQEDYEKGKPTGNPKGNIPISQLTLRNITGSMSGDSNSVAVYILCGTGGCSNWNWTEISISNAKKANTCNFTPSGFTC